MWILRAGLSNPDPYRRKEIRQICRFVRYVGKCTEVCPQNIRETAGRVYGSELVKELRKDEMFYEESGGGVTLSGGEVMAMDMDYIEALVKKLYRLGITVTIDMWICTV